MGLSELCGEAGGEEIMGLLAECSKREIGLDHLWSEFQ